MSFKACTTYFLQAFATLAAGRGEACVVYVPVIIHSFFQVSSSNCFVNGFCGCKSDIWQYGSLHEAKLAQSFGASIQLHQLRQLPHLYPNGFKSKSCLMQENMIFKGQPNQWAPRMQVFSLKFVYLFDIVDVCTQHCRAILAIWVALDC